MTAIPVHTADHVHAIQYRMDQLFRLWRTTTFVGTADLARLNELIARSLPEEIKQAVSFLDGLVEWRESTSG